LERTPSEDGGEEIKLGEVARVSDFKLADFVGVAADFGVGSSPVTADISLSGLSESGRRLRPAGRWRAGEGEVLTAGDGLDRAWVGDKHAGGSSSSSSSSTRVWS